MYQYWGKADHHAYHLLVYHCLDVAAVGKVWLEQSSAFVKRASEAAGLSEKAFVECFLFFLALHDVGKFDVRFQNLRPDLLWNLQGKKEKAGEFIYSPRHDQRGFEYFSEHIFSRIHSLFFPETKSTPLKEYLEILALVTLGHHGRPPSKKTVVVQIPSAVHTFSEYLFNYFLSSSSIEEITAIITLPKKERRDTVANLKYFSWQLAGLTTLCDWIASGDETFVFLSKELELSKYFDDSCIKAEKALKRAEVISAPLSRHSGLGHLFPDYAATPTPLQKFCNEAEVTSSPQMWILEDVTGAGKTEAALILASRILAEGGGSGCFVALPTMATSNAMYERMSKVYSLLYEEGAKPSLSLSHGSRHLSKTFSDSYRTSLNDLPQSGMLYNENSDEGRAHCSQWLADSSKKALLSDVGVGTVDQILMAGLPLKYQSLRAFGMAQKVLIVDEIHAFDAYMHKLLVNVISAQAAFGGSVILLSATLPFSIREKFCNAFSDGLSQEVIPPEVTEAFPLVTAVTHKGVSETSVDTRSSVARVVHVSFCEDVDFVYSLIIKSIDEGKCVCWIRNTISDVTDSYDELQKRSIEKIDMFHSRFALKDRLEIENRILARFGKNSTPKERHGQVLVASQVVEQSLDLDFDLMISDLAPIDLLIQRAGRLQRHERGKRDKPVFYVHIPEDTDEPDKNWFSDAFPKAAFVYKDVALLWRTKEILKKQKQLKMPEEARLLIESVYGEEGEITSDVFIEAEDSASSDRMSQRALADLNRLKFEKGYSCMSNDCGKWESEEAVPTRLSDKTNKIYLCTWINDSIEPLFKHEEYAWDLSSLTLRSYSLASIDYDDEISSSIDELKKQKRFQYDTLFLVFKDNCLELKGKDEKGREVVVKYNSKTGLSVFS